MFSWTIVSPSCPIVPSSHRPTVLIIIPLCLSSIPIPSAHSHFHLRFGCVTWPSRILVTAFTLIKAKNVGLYTGSSRPDPVPQRHNSIFGHQFNCDGVCCTHLIPLSASSSSFPPSKLLSGFYAQLQAGTGAEDGLDPSALCPRLMLSIAKGHHNNYNSPQPPPSL